MAVSLGFAGIFLPVLPTTPFLLLAAFCYARASERVYQWLLAHPLLGRYIRDYRLRGGMTRKAKVVSLVTMWITSIASILFFIPFLWLKTVVVLAGIMVTWHILRLHTVSEDESLSDGGNDG